MARLHGTPIRDISAGRRDGLMYTSGVGEDSTAVIKSPGARRSNQFPAVSSSTLRKRSSAWDEIQDKQEKGEHHGGLARTRGESRSNLVWKCRDHSQSAWLHFPHIELLFLFFAFDGAIAAQVSALWSSRCPWVLALAAAALVSRIFPVIYVTAVQPTGV